MKKIFYLYSKSLLSKLALVAILVIGGGNFVWAQKDLPYSYGFENNDLAAEGWTKTSTQSMSMLVTTANTGCIVYERTYSFRFYYKNTEDQYLISPELNNSDTGIDVSFYYNNNGTGSSYVEKFQVGYSKTNTEISSFTWGDEITSNDTNWHKFEQSYSSGVKYIAIKYLSASKYRLFIDNINIDISETYKRPKNLAVNSLTNSSATFNWTESGTETNWQIAYSTKSDFIPSTEGTKVTVTENPYTLSNLTDGVTYYAYVRSNYSGNYSEWSNRVDFSPKYEKMINETASGQSGCYVPIYGTKANHTYRCQFVVPGSLITDIEDCYIKKLVFYSTQTSVSWSDIKFDIYLKNVNFESFSSVDLESDWGTMVGNNITPSVSNGTMEIELETPFLYEGDNLMIGFDFTTPSSNTPTITWYSVSSSNCSVYYYYSYTNSSSVDVYIKGRGSYLPKIAFTTFSSKTPATIGLNGYMTFASPRALDLANLPSGLKAYKAAVDAQNNKVLFTEINQAVPANTGMLLEGTAETTYNIPVAESGTTPVDNAFLVNSTGGTFTADEGYTYYGMKKATSAEDAIVFATFAPATVAIPTNKAYLKVENAPSGASRQLVCVFSDNTTTAIAEIANRQNGQNSYFNLAGQRVDGSRFTVNGSGLKPGLYIINGKKVVIK